MCKYVGYCCKKRARFVGINIVLYSNLYDIALPCRKRDIFLISFMYRCILFSVSMSMYLLSKLPLLNAFCCVLPRQQCIKLHTDQLLQRLASWEPRYEPPLHSSYIAAIMYRRVQEGPSVGCEFLAPLQLLVHHSNIVLKGLRLGPQGGWGIGALDWVLRCCVAAGVAAGGRCSDMLCFDRNILDYKPDVNNTV